MTDHTTTSLTSDQSLAYPSTVFPQQPTPEITTIDDAIAAYPDTELRYAVDRDKEDITWAPRRGPHTLISGHTGSGKAALIHALIVDATRHGWEVVVINLSGIGYTRYRDWPNVSMVITEAEQAIAVIDHLHRVMGQRLQVRADDAARPRRGLRWWRRVWWSRRQQPPRQVTPMLIVIDDYAELTALVNRFYAEHKPPGGPRECPTVTQVSSMLRLARAARMHLLLAVQRPDLQSMAPDVRDNLGHRVSLGRLSPEHAALLWDSEKVGCDVPIGVPGRGIARNQSGEPVEVQCYFTPSPVNEDDPQLRRTAEQLRPSVSLYPRKVVAPPTPVNDGDGPMPFSHFQNAGIHLADDRPDLDPLA